MAVSTFCRVQPLKSSVALRVAQADAKQRADNVSELTRLLAAEKERQQRVYKWQIEKVRCTSPRSRLPMRAC